VAALEALARARRAFAAWARFAAARAALRGRVETLLCAREAALARRAFSALAGGARARRAAAEGGGGGGGGAR
jgi:hypothetical protein